MTFKRSFKIVKPTSHSDEIELFEFDYLLLPLLLRLSERDMGRDSRELFKNFAFYIIRHLYIVSKTKVAS